MDKILARFPKTVARLSHQTPTPDKNESRSLFNQTGMALGQADFKSGSVAPLFAGASNLPEKWCPLFGLTR
jgi:hypothetical protein